MNKSIRLTALLVAIPLLTLAQNQRTPYEGQQSREIKALSDAEVQAYLGGRGMGLAKAAELNGYPGPMHVLELAAQLKLSAAQKTETQIVFERMRQEAVRLGKTIVEKEADLNRLFAGQEANSNNLPAAVAEIARLQGELRSVHLRAHLEMKRVLSRSQIEKYDELRGYGTTQHDRNGRGNH